MNKKKLVTLAMALSMVAILVVGGTIAYFTDTAYNANTMTYGGVDIEQWEYQRKVGEDGEYETAEIDGQTSYVLEGFQQDKPLLPIVGDPSSSGDSYAGWNDETTVRMSQVGSYGGMTVFAGKVPQDKFVVVKNVGKSDAYVRTLVAIEIGTSTKNLVRSSYHKNWEAADCGTIEVLGNTYKVVEYLYKGAQESDGTWVRHENGIVPPNDMTYPNLAQVYLKHNAVNEDVPELDGNKNGKLDILVLSQAAQASGFADARTALDTAFGEPTKENLESWFAEHNPGEQ